jgi:hypothetical protein
VCAIIACAARGTGCDDSGCVVGDWEVDFWFARHTGSIFANTQPRSSAVISARNGSCYFSPVSQFVTNTTGALLSVTEFNTRNRPSRDTS